MDKFADILKRLMNVLSLLFILHVLFVFLCVASMLIFDYPLGRDTYLDYGFRRDVHVWYSLILIPAALVSINYIVFKRITLWHKSK